ncbi:MAG: carboxypeptidase-like regulatory domain-containing protein [Mangrovibacterium sp.]|nr:carboxypeptidase-like regulatory domain-containing protein [Mangrovibacterium sp.]
MMNKTLTILLLFAITPGNDLWGQKSEGKRENIYPAEEMTIHFSQKCVLTGEAIFFKVYCTSPLYPAEELSRMAYIELVNAENVSVIREKILLANGQGTGEFVIPEKLKTGIYHVLGYTNWMKNFGEGSFFKTPIMVICPEESFTGNDEKTAGRLKTPEIRDKENRDAQLTVTPDKNHYSTRVKATLKINAEMMAGGALSVSVAREEPGMYAGMVSGEGNPLQPDSILYLPDYKGIRLTGNLTDSTGSAVTGEKVVVSFPGQGTDVNSTKTDATGNFHFLLKPNTGHQDLVFTLPHPDLKLALEEPFRNGFRVLPSLRSLIPDQDALAFLNEKYAHKQLQEKFKQEYLTRIPSAGPVKNSDRCFYGEPQQIIRMNEYIKLDSLTEYFWELIPSVRYVKHRGDFAIFVINPATLKPYEEAPGVFIDGVLYPDYNKIAAIPVEQVSRIAIIAKVYYYHDFTFGGIVDIHTRNGDFKSVPVLPGMVRIMYPLGKTPEIRYNTVKEASRSRMPDLRYLICWDPDIRLNDQGEAVVDFYTSDVEGEYVVQVVGLSSDGKIMQDSRTISVRSD